MISIASSDAAAQKTNFGNLMEELYLLEVVVVVVDIWRLVCLSDEQQHIKRLWVLKDLMFD